MYCVKPDGSVTADTVDEVLALLTALGNSSGVRVVMRAGNYMREQMVRKWFIEHPEPIAPPDLAHHIGIHKATAYSIMYRLAQNGYLARAGTRKFAQGRPMQLWKPTEKLLKEAKNASQQATA